jgi:hypothetical protein
MNTPTPGTRKRKNKKEARRVGIRLVVELSPCSFHKKNRKKRTVQKEKKKWTVQRKKKDTRQVSLRLVIELFARWGVAEEAVKEHERLPPTLESQWRRRRSRRRRRIYSYSMIL